MSKIFARVHYPRVGHPQVYIDGYNVTDSVYKFEIVHDADHPKPRLTIEIPWVLVTSEKESTE